MKRNFLLSISFVVFSAVAATSCTKTVGAPSKNVNTKTSAGVNTSNGSQTQSGSGCDGGGHTCGGGGGCGNGNGGNGSGY